jgi:hypothetical protein
MWPLLLGLWKARRGRRAAVATISPFVESSRRRLKDIPESAWLDPYLVGFMVMFITLVARREVNALDTQALGLVQCGAWGEITGMKDDLIGEETLHLCATGDRDFERGCRDAIAIDLALYRSEVARNSDLGIGGLNDDLGFGLGGERDPEIDDVMLLWQQYFETQITSCSARSNMPGPGIGSIHSAA